MSTDYFSRTDDLLKEVKTRIDRKTDQDIARALKVTKANISNFRNRRNKLGTCALLRAWAIIGLPWAITALNYLAEHEEHSNSLRERRTGAPDPRGPGAPERRITDETEPL
jgi:transcriptional regulator with XRE-family HTH domain